MRRFRQSERNRGIFEHKYIYLLHFNVSLEVRETYSQEFFEQDRNIMRDLSKQITCGDSRNKSLLLLHFNVIILFVRQTCRFIMQNNFSEVKNVHFSKDVERMICVKKGPHHGPAPIPEEGK